MLPDLTSEGKFWYMVWRLVAISIVSVIAIVGGCTMNNARVINEMVNRGVPAIEASCAIGGMQESARAAICAQQVKSK